MQILIRYLSNLRNLNRQRGIAVLPVLILVAAIGGVLAGTIAVQQQTQTQTSAQSNTTRLTVETYIDDRCEGSGYQAGTDRHIAVPIDLGTDSGVSQSKTTNSSTGTAFFDFTFADDNDRATVAAPSSLSVTLYGQQYGVRLCNNNVSVRPFGTGDLGSLNNKYTAFRYELTGTAPTEPPATNAPTAGPTNTVPSPDLQVRDIKWNPATVNAGDSVEFSADIFNSGGRQVLQDFYIELFIDGASVKKHRTTNNITSNTTVNIPILNYNFTPQTAKDYTVKVVVDSDDEVAEDSENNNDRTETLIVGGDSLQCPDRPTDSGDNINCSAQTGNSNDYNRTPNIQDFTFDYQLDQAGANWTKPAGAPDPVEYRLSLMYRTASGEEGVWTGWPNRITTTDTFYNFYSIPKETDTGKDISTLSITKVWVLVRAIYPRGQEDPSESNINRQCFCRSNTAKSAELDSGIPTPTPIPGGTAGLRVFVGFTPDPFGNISSACSTGNGFFPFHKRAEVNVGSESKDWIGLENGSHSGSNPLTFTDLAAGTYDLSFGGIEETQYFKGHPDCRSDSVTLADGETKDVYLYIAGECLENNDPNCYCSTETSGDNCTARTEPDGQNWEEKHDLDPAGVRNFCGHSFGCYPDIPTQPPAPPPGGDNTCIWCTDKATCDERPEFTYYPNRPDRCSDPNASGLCCRSNETVPTPPPASTPGQQCSVNGAACGNNSECCSNSCDRSQGIPGTCRPAGDTSCSVNGADCGNNSECCSNNCDLSGGVPGTCRAPATPTPQPQSGSGTISGYAYLCTDPTQLLSGVAVSVKDKTSGQTLTSTTTGSDGAYQTGSFSCTGAGRINQNMYVIFSKQGYETKTRGPEACPINGENYSDVNGCLTLSSGNPPATPTPGASSPVTNTTECVERGGECFFYCESFQEEIGNCDDSFLQPFPCCKPPVSGNRTQTAAAGDLNCDGNINALDMSTALANYRGTVNASCQGGPVLVTIQTYLAITNAMGTP